MDGIVQNPDKVNETITFLINCFQKYGMLLVKYGEKIPYASTFFKYIYNVVKANPLRILLEVFLIIFLIMYIRKDRYKITTELKNQLTEKVKYLFSFFIIINLINIFKSIDLFVYLNI